MVRMDNEKVILERGDEGYEEAWMGLIDSGKNPNDFMYMYTEKSTGKALFKHKLMRNYVSVEA